MLEVLEDRGRVGTAEGPMSLDVYGSVALAPPTSRSLVPSELASPQRKTGVHGWFPAPWWLLTAWVTSLHAAHRGLDGAARGRQCALQGLPTTPCAPGMLLLQAPQDPPPHAQTPGDRLP